MTLVSSGALAAGHAIRVVAEFAEKHLHPSSGSADFTFGNPQESPLVGLVDAIKAAAEPQSNDWFAYTTNDENATEVIASALSKELALTFAPEDITMTQGAFTAIASAFDLLLNPGDEVLHPKPGWFAYAPILAARGYVSVPTPLDPITYDLDLEAIERAITPRTRIVVVNSPHNPTGRVYTRPANACRNSPIFWTGRLPRSASASSSCPMSHTAASVLAGSDSPRLPRSIPGR